MAQEITEDQGSGVRTSAVSPGSIEEGVDHSDTTHALRFGCVIPRTPVNVTR